MIGLNLRAPGDSRRLSLALFRRTSVSYIRVHLACAAASLAFLPFNIEIRLEI